MGKNLEILAALQSMLWGAWLLMPWDTFSLSSVYRLMRFLPEELLGAVIFGFGVVSLYIVYADKTTNCRLRCPITMAGVVMWIGIAIWFSLGDYRGLVIANALGTLLTYSFARFELQTFQNTWKRKHES